MALFKFVFPKLFWVVIFAVQVIQSTDSDTIEPDKRGETLVICENGQNYIECPNGAIRIKNANYGRTDANTCPHNQISNQNCKTTNTIDIIRKKCENKVQCHLEASNNIFGDPCVNTYKYLKVDYICRQDLPVYSELICESGSKQITCPESTIIKVKNASYGRMDKNTCPNESIKTTNCIAENSLSIVKKRCENNNECHLEASNSWFNDPCEGTYKYLSVEYQCEQDQFRDSRTITICELEKKKIKCPKDTCLVIEDAFYGRTDKSICSHAQGQNIECKAANAFKIVNSRCNHKKECELESTNTWFGDPCEGTHKYLQVKYKCVKDENYDLQTITICEFNTQKVKCPKDTSLIIEDAFYGRTDKSICPHAQGQNIQCKAGNAFQIVNKRCNQKAECQLESSNTWFGDPCVGTNKYLQVKYKCVKG